MLKEIVIEENRLSDKNSQELNSNKQILTQLDIQKLSVKNIAEVLQYVLGVQATRRGHNNAQTDIKINGGTFEQSLILLNGHPILDPQTGHHLMNLPITVFDIEQIEILTGPQAHAYGINGIAGAINIVTKKVKENQIAANVITGSDFQKDTSNGNIFNTSNLQLGISNISKYARQYLSLSTDIGNGFMYNTQTKNYKGFYTNDITTSNGHKLSFLASYINNSFGANGFYASPFDNNSVEKVNTFFTALKHEKKLNKAWTIKSNISARANKDIYTFKKQNPSYYQNTHKTKSYFANTNLNYGYKKGELGVGLSYNVQQINSSNLGVYERNNIGFFAQNIYRFTQKLSTTIGLFTNYNSQWGISVLPGFDIGYQATKSLKFYAAIGTANRMPTYTDLYYKGPSNIGNDKLIQEKSIGFDLGAKYATQKIQASINAFNRQVNDLIDWTKPTTAAVWQPSNFGLQKVYGLQCYSNFNISDAKLLSFRNITFNYQYNSINVKNNINTIISRYALDYFKHQIIANTTFDFTKHIFATASIRYQNRFNFIDYTLVDARIGYNAKQYLLYADVNNMTNTKYKESNAMPMPSRWFSIGANVRFVY
jgi:iron complex outermembrane receptor protein